MKKKAIVIAGTKGGVGKSTAACYIAGALTDMGKSIKMIDADDENPTFSRLWGDDVEKMDKKGAYPLDMIVDALEHGEEEFILVDLKAGTGDETLSWFLEVPFDELKEFGVEFIVCGCVTADVDSVKTLLKWGGSLAGNCEMVVFLNEKDGEVEPVYKKYGANLEKGYKPDKVTIPKLNEIYINALNQSDATVYHFINKMIEIDHPNFKGIMAASRLRKHYVEVSDQIKEIFNEPGE